MKKPERASENHEIETVKHIAGLANNAIFSLETLTVNGHFKRGIYVPGHLHFNITFLAEADEKEELMVNKDENQGVRWWPLEEVSQVSKEPWMVERIYKKLIEKDAASKI